MFKTKWSKWMDLSVGHINDSIYVVQVKRHLNGKIKFRVAHTSGAWCQIPRLELSHFQNIKPNQ